MLLALQLGLGLNIGEVRRPDDPGPSIGQLPVDFFLARTLLGVVLYRGHLPTLWRAGSGARRHGGFLIMATAMTTAIAAFVATVATIEDVSLHLIKAGSATLALEATRPIDNDEGHQCQPQNDQPLS